MKKENILPINAFYITWLRDKGRYNRPAAQWADKQTGEITESTELSGAGWLLYIMLLSRADSKTLICFPSLETICRDCGMDRRKLWKHIAELEQMGFITVTKERGKPNRYYMLDFAQWKQDPHY